jgi:DNA-binding transcriptional LysR family regulator
VCCFGQFSLELPHTRIRVLETSLSGTTEALLEKQADIVIDSTTPPGFSGRPVGDISMVAVAASRHALIADRNKVSEFELRSHRQIVLRDTGTKRKVDSGVSPPSSAGPLATFQPALSCLSPAWPLPLFQANGLPQRWQKTSLPLSLLAKASSGYFLCI